MIHDGRKRYDGEVSSRRCMYEVGCIGSTQPDEQARPGTPRRTRMPLRGHTS